jgi:predicted MFS family arabinose efflux permease
MAYGASPEAIALAFALVGAAGVAGNYGAARLVARLGIERSILMLLASIASGLAIIALLFGSFTAFLAGGCLWGLGSFASNSLQQSRLVAMAPALAPATVALNTSFVYFGQSLGSAAGGAIIAHGPSSTMAWAGGAFLVAAMGLSVAAKRSQVDG